jgi:hypothetical protein
MSENLKDLRTNSTFAIFILLGCNHSNLCQLLPYFNDRFATEYQPLNLDRLQYFIDSGRLSTESTITIRHLRDSGVLPKLSKNVKLLGNVSLLLQSNSNIETTELEANSIILQTGGGMVFI